MSSDTIAAIATAPGEGGIAIVRVSGPMTADILRSLFRPASPAVSFPLPDRQLIYGHVMDGEAVVDEGLAVMFHAPHSYTREDVGEFQLHGGQAVAQKVLELCLMHGARLSEPGEFTRRAFLNGRLDLSQAEAVMALIRSRGEQARKAAMEQLQGGTSQFIRTCADRLYAIQASLAACLDYPEEIEDGEALEDLLPRIADLEKELRAALHERASRILHHGLQVALCGRPNVGKSSLLNALLGEEKAIVTAIPGTTRDMVEGEISLGGGIIHLVDTAGVRETEDAVEQVGVSRAKRAAASADLTLFLLDSSSPLEKDELDLAADLKRQGARVVLVCSKSDLPRVLDLSPLRVLFPESPVLSLSALTPETLSPLRELLLQEVSVSDRMVLTQPRHLDAARRAADHLLQALETLKSSPLDLVTLDLDQAQAALGEITGDQVEERLLDEVFSTFCVGK